MIVNAENALVGRLSVMVAKKLILGEEVAVVNVEKAVFSGEAAKVVEVYRKRRGMQNKANPEHSAKWPRRPDYLFKRIVGGMLPKKPSGEAALKRLKAYMGVPAELTEKAKSAETPKKKAAGLLCDSISLGEMCARLGWKQ